MADALHDAVCQAQILQAEGDSEEGVCHFQGCISLLPSTCTLSVSAPRHADLVLQVLFCVGAGLSYTVHILYINNTMKQFNR